MFSKGVSRLYSMTLLFLNINIIHFITPQYNALKINTLATTQLLFFIFFKKTKAKVWTSNL